VPASHGHRRLALVLITARHLRQRYSRLLHHDAQRSPSTRAAPLAPTHLDSVLKPACVFFVSAACSPWRVCSCAYLLATCPRLSGAYTGIHLALLPLPSFLAPWRVLLSPSYLLFSPSDHLCTCDKRPTMQGCARARDTLRLHKHVETPCNCASQMTFEYLRDLLVRRS
jgi:hypothetical protein